MFEAHREPEQIGRGNLCRTLERRAMLDRGLGPAQAQSLQARYRAMMGSLSNAGAVELVAQRRQGMNTPVQLLTPLR